LRNNTLAFGNVKSIVEGSNTRYSEDALLHVYGLPVPLIPKNISHRNRPKPVEMFKQTVCPLLQTDCQHPPFSGMAGFSQGEEWLTKAMIDIKFQSWSLMVQPNHFAD